VDETPQGGEGARGYVERLAAAKALAAEATSDETVLAADTTVTIDGALLGKPADAADARRMISLLSGRRHEVLTGICLRKGNSVITDCATTAVWFHTLSGEEIDEYVASGEPEGKAGAYAIQGLASKFVDRIEGCYFNVMGLPVSLVYRQLMRLSLSGVDRILL
jgi:septum formation protein